MKFIHYAYQKIYTIYIHMTRWFMFIFFFLKKKIFGLEILLFKNKGQDKLTNLKRKKNII